VTGLVIRLLLAFPIYQFPAQSDVVLAGMCSEKVLSGEFPVFYAGFRNGSLVCYSTAVLSLVTGQGRVPLALEPVVMGLALMVFWYMFVRALFGWRIGLAALPFIAVPPPSVGFWLSMPNSYPETMTLCAAILWLAVECARRPALLNLLAFGAAMGLGFWSSLLTLGVSIPASLWLVATRTEVLKPRWFLTIAASFFGGALPYLAFNLRYGWPSFTDNFAAQPASGVSAVLENVVFLLQTNLPLLAADLEPTHLVATGVGRIVEIAVAAVVLLSFAVYFVFGRPPAGDRESPDGAPNLYERGKWLVGGVLLTIGLLFVLSTPGSLRTLTVRYVLPAALLIPPVLAITLLWIRSRRRIAAAVMAVGILAFNLAALEFPWQESRQEMLREARSYDTLLSELAEAGVELVVGPYWDSYAATYLSNGAVIGVPIEVEHDHVNVVEDLPRFVRRWALVHSRGQVLEEWSSLLQIPGTMRTSGRFHAFVSEPGSWPAQELVRHLQTVLPRR
jgi:hypothetical protein